MPEHDAETRPAKTELDRMADLMLLFLQFFFLLGFNVAEVRWSNRIDRACNLYGFYIHNPGAICYPLAELSLV
jgi:hypothetical protein